VFYYEILSNLNDACAIAKGAFEDAINELESIESDQYKDSTTILQLIKDNLTNWTSETNEVRFSIENTHKIDFSKEGEENEQN